MRLLLAPEGALIAVIVKRHFPSATNLLRFSLSPCYMRIYRGIPYIFILLHELLKITTTRSMQPRAT